MPQIQGFLDRIIASCDRVDGRSSETLVNEVLQGIQCHCHNFKAACAADFENFSLEFCVNNHHSDDDPNEVIFFFFPME